MDPTNLFANVQQAPPDPILGTAEAFKKDTDPNKVNLGVGAYRTDEGLPYIFQSVREAERLIYSNPSINKEYLPMRGLDSFNTLARELLLTKTSPAVKENRVASIQTLSGTGSLRLGAEFLKEFFNTPAIYVSSPTWGNHLSIFKKAGIEVREYPYWDSKTKGFNFTGMIESLKNAPQHAVILLHVCAHNPTGVDPTKEQWHQIAEVMASKKLIPFFDSAYQGFASGDLDNDAYSVRYFVAQGFQCLISQSFAKNMGLYGERIGGLHVVCTDTQTSVKVLSQLEILARIMYSNPPLHGAYIVSTILSDATLRQNWQTELSNVAKRIIQMRHSLLEELTKIKVPGTWTHITSQIGMFSYTGLNTAQCENLINKWHCYLVKNGRISMSGVNTKNVGYLARAIKDSVDPQPKL